ncbi:MAG TPA: DUF2630 family protein [Actinomycetota bacterium]
MEDQAVFNRIEELSEEEHELLRRAGSGGLSQEEHARLNDLQVQLDRCWDLMRQRRARRDAGLEPDDAQARDAGTVEDYWQ